MSGRNATEEPPFMRFVFANCHLLYVSFANNVRRAFRFLNCTSPTTPEEQVPQRKPLPKRPCPTVLGHLKPRASALETMYALKLKMKDLLFVQSQTLLRACVS